MTTTPANDKQVGGDHYKKMPIEHWDIVSLLGLDYFQGQITKYVMRWRNKGGLADLEKGLHVYQKYVEIETARSKGLQPLAELLLQAAINKLKNDAEEDRRFGQPHYGHDEHSDCFGSVRDLYRDAERYRWLKTCEVKIVAGKNLVAFEDGHSLDRYIDRHLQSDQREAIKHQEGD